MDITQIGMIGLISAILILTLKRESPQIALVISMATGVLLMILILPKLSVTIDMLEDLISQMNVDIKYISIIIKIIGIVYIAEFCSQICIDSGESSIASKIELGAKVLIIASSMPIVLGLLDMINHMLP